MTAKDEKKRRQMLVRRITDANHRLMADRVPIPVDALSGLFDFLDVKLTEHGCDHSLRSTRDYLASRQLPIDAVVAWLGEHGGYCDCEVLANVEDAWRA